MAFRSTGTACVRRLLHSYTRVSLSKGPLRFQPTNNSADACRRLVSVSTARSFAATASHPKDSSGKSSDKKADDSNVFLDNLGKIFLSAIGLIIASLVRSSYGSTNRNNVRDELENKASLDPFEIDDLRVANSQLTPDVFRTIMQDVQDAFPYGTASYRDFVHAVRRTMIRLKGDAFTVELGHLLDRAVISALDKEGIPEDEQVPLPFLLAALSLTLNSSVSDRITVLYESLQLKNGTVTFDDVLHMVGYLQQTSQLVPDTQVVEGDTKYPAQQYERGTPQQLVQWDGSNADVMDQDAFTAILTSRSVCAWGECYVKKKKPAAAPK